MYQKFYAIVIAAIMVLSGCDFIRVMRITNKSNHSVQLITDHPHYMRMIADSTSKSGIPSQVKWKISSVKYQYDSLQIDSTAEDLIINLLPSESFNIGESIGQNQPLNSWDLNYNRIKIISITDTIIANDKDEILKLLELKKYEYIEELDAKDLHACTPYFRHLVIRD